MGHAVMAVLMDIMDICVAVQRIVFVVRQAIAASVSMILSMDQFVTRSVVFHVSIELATLCREHVIKYASRDISETNVTEYVEAIAALCHVIEIRAYVISVRYRGVSLTLSTNSCCIYNRRCHMSQSINSLFFICYKPK
jgi:hypothetical protein